MNFDLADLNSVGAVSTAAVKGNAVLIIKLLLGLGAVILLGKSVILNKKLVAGGNLNLNMNLKVNAATAAVKKITATFTAATAAGANNNGNKIIIRIAGTGKINIFIITLFLIINALIWGEIYTA